MSNPQITNIDPHYQHLIIPLTIDSLIHLISSIKQITLTKDQITKINSRF